MCDAILHRGPDSDGYFLSDGIAMGMRRLSIIDVQGGRQPISNEDGTVSVVFNGEIYNHHALRTRLERGGHKFATRSDTEVLVHLYEDHGADMVQHLHGMFAFSIWDSKRRTLLIARDRSGMKPLSYRAFNDGIVYCSELRSLYAFDPAPLQIAPASVMQYLAFGYVPDPNSIFEGVRKLPPGHLLTWIAGHGIDVRRYWSPPHSAYERLDEDTAVEIIRQKLDSAVVSHLEAEVPLGAFLSGGLDSSTIVALMSRHASGRVNTFSIGFAEEKYDESGAARSVAEAFGTEHRDLIVRPNVEELFESIAAMFDEPFADSSAIPTFLVSQLARESVTVALSGDAGDELFGGYTRYGESLRHADGPPLWLRRLYGAIGLMLPHAVPGRNRIVDLGRSRAGRYAATLLQPLRVDEGGIASQRYPEGMLRIDEHLARRFSAEFGNDFSAAMMRVDFETYLPGDILTKVDRTSMAVSLEARVPLLDADLVDFALALPGHLRVTGSESKRLFRRAIRGIVPDFVLNRPKRGFEVPLGSWFRGPLRHRIEALRNPSRSIQPYVDTAAVRRLVNEHVVGRRDHSAQLWRLIVLDYWLTSFNTGLLGRPPSLPGSSTKDAAATTGGIRNVPLEVPASVSQPFLTAKIDSPRLRVGVLVDAAGIPGYARGIIQDINEADYVDLVLVIVAKPSSDSPQVKRTEGLAFKTYVSHVEARFRTDPDPLEMFDLEDLAPGAHRISVQVADYDTSREMSESDVAGINAAKLDVLVDFGAKTPRGTVAKAARCGVWRYHFGDSRIYPAGSGFLREIIDRSALTAMELIKLGETRQGDEVLTRVMFSTVPFLSRSANRFAPIWGGRHFVIQNLWKVQHRRDVASGQPAIVENSGIVRRAKSTRVPGNLEMGRWMVGEAGRRLLTPLRHVNRALHWRIGVRRSTVPLFMDSTVQSLHSFRWLESPPGEYWADPFLLARSDGNWLFFEHFHEARGLGQIFAGRLNDDGRLLEPRPVMRLGYHLSYPQLLEFDGEVFMLPESAQSGGLDLYRSSRFPHDWVLEKRLLDFPCVDSSIFRAEGYWWLVTSPQVVPGHAPITWIFRADRIQGPWHIQPASPIAVSAEIARGAGAVFEFEGRLVRPSQDCSKAYGQALLFNEILTLTDDKYVERTICRVESGWAAGLAGVHAYTRAGAWEAIDGGFE